MENYNQDLLADQGLRIDEEASQHLAEAAKWTKFLSVTMFVLCGVLLLFGVFGASAMIAAFSSKLGGGQLAGLGGGLGAGVVIAIIIFVVAIMVVYYYFMYNFSNKIKLGISSGDTSLINAGINSLKTFFIITIVFSGISLLSTVIGLF
jgi:hypothetical protein